MPAILFMSFTSAAGYTSPIELHARCVCRTGVFRDIAQSHCARKVHGVRPAYALLGVPRSRSKPLASNGQNRSTSANVEIEPTNPFDQNTRMSPPAPIIDRR